MKKYITELILLCFICALFGFFVGNLTGANSKQKEIINRAKLLPEDKQFYSSQEIDFILFNESQL